MNCKDINIKYVGLAPSDFTKAYIENILYEIYEESPYGATLNSSFSKNKDFIKGTVQINSSVGPFFATASDDNFPEVTRKLSEQLRRRLKKWKSKRFKHESAKYNFNQNYNKEAL